MQQEIKSNASAATTAHNTTRANLRKALEELLSRFTCEGIKSGDLVITAEIHRVVEPFGDQLAVVTLWPPCDYCSGVPQVCEHTHIMRAGPGQQGIMKLI